MKIVRKRWNDIVPNKITDNNPLNVYLEKEKELSNISWFITKYSVSMIRLNFGESALDPLRNENDCIKVDNFKWIIKIVEDQMSIVYPNTIDRNPLDIDSVKELVKITTFLYNHTKSIVLNMMVWGVSASLVKFNFTTNRMDPPYHASKKMVNIMLNTKYKSSIALRDYWASAFLCTRNMRFLERLDNICQIGSKFSCHPFKSFMNNTEVANEYGKYLQHCNNNNKSD